MNLQRLTDLFLSVFDETLCGKKGQFNPDNPAEGLCSVASEAAWFILGGSKTGWIAQMARDPDPNALWSTHWWLKNIDGTLYDPTRSQYELRNSMPPYEKNVFIKGTGFQGIRKVNIDDDPWGIGYTPSKRAELLLRKCLNISKKQKLIIVWLIN